MDVRSLQRPLKDLYRQDPVRSQNRMTARHGSQTVLLRVLWTWGGQYTGRKRTESVARVPRPAPEVLLLGALAACAQIAANGCGYRLNTLKGSKCHGRGRSGSARNAGNIERRLSGSGIGQFRRPRAMQLLSS